MIYLFEDYSLDADCRELRRGPELIAVEPQVFDFLQYLISNRERVVSKDELIAVVWGGRIVSESAISSRITAVRHAVGDSGEAQRLIRTIARKGLRFVAAVREEQRSAKADLLPRRDEQNDAAPVGETSHSSVNQAPGYISRPNNITKLVQPRVATQDAAPASQPFSDGRVPDFLQPLQRLTARLSTRRSLLGGDLTGRRRVWLAAGGLACLVLGATYLLVPLWAHHLPPRVSELFTEADARRVAAIAADKQLPLPAFQIIEPARDAPKGLRRFVGVWVSDTGWPNSNRQLMLIVTRVDQDGFAIGYAVDGPPQPLSHVQSPAGFHSFRARISGPLLSYGNEYDERVVSFTPENRAVFHKKWRDGFSGSVWLAPVWTLIDAESVADANRVAR